MTAMMMMTRKMTVIMIVVVVMTMLMIVMKITIRVMRMRMMITTECITVQRHLKQHLMSARFRGGGRDERSLAMYSIHILVRENTYSLSTFR